MTGQHHVSPRAKGGSTGPVRWAVVDDDLFDTFSNRLVDTGLRNLNPTEIDEFTRRRWVRKFGRYWKRRGRGRMFGVPCGRGERAVSGRYDGVGQGNGRGFVRRDRRGASRR